MPLNASAMESCWRRQLSRSSATANSGSIPAKTAFSFSRRAQNPCTVDTQARSNRARIAASSRNASTRRDRILPAAFSVKVMARMRSGSAPAATSLRKYSTRTVVFPEPGPATTQASRPTLARSMAASCAGVYCTSFIDPPRSRLMPHSVRSSMAGNAVGRTPWPAAGPLAGLFR